MKLPRRKLKILLLFNSPYFKPRGYDFKEEMSDPDNMYTEKDVLDALRENGYQVSVIGLYNDLSPLLEEIRENRPDVIFNMADVFNETTQFDKNIAALLELFGIPYTGSSTGCLFVCNDKALSKKILSFHRIKVPHFYTFYRKHKVWLPKKLKLPVIVKPLCEEASRGISQASIVDSEESFLERIKFIHENMGMDAIAEEYIEGREFYVPVLGNKRLTALPPRELKFGQLPEDEPRIATYKAKWDDNYRDRWGIKSVFPGKLAEGVEDRIAETCKRAYRALNMDGYGRFDIRVTSDGKVYIIEPNANPCIAKIDEVAQAAAKMGISYPQLVKRIVLQAFQREK
jgi:D-alanine-D-alanine ligase